MGNITVAAVKYPKYNSRLVHKTVKDEPKRNLRYPKELLSVEIVKSLLGDFNNLKQRKTLQEFAETS